MARDNAASYLRQKRLAIGRGFASVRAMRRAKRAPRSLDEYRSLPEDARTSRSEVDRILRIARRQKLPIETVAAEQGVPLVTVRWWFPDAVEGTRGGRTLPTKADRYLRVRTFVNATGQRVFVPVRGSDAARRAEHVNDVQWRWVHGRATTEELQGLGGITIAGQAVGADPETLRRTANLGEFDPEDVYRELF